MSKPILGAVIGILAGAAIGILGAYYFDLADWLSRVCLVASSVLVFQLLGATIAATIGKPHDIN